MRLLNEWKTFSNLVSWSCEICGLIYQVVESENGKKKSYFKNRKFNGFFKWRWKPQHIFINSFHFFYIIMFICFFLLIFRNRKRCLKCSWKKRSRNTLRIKTISFDLHFTLPMPNWQHKEKMNSSSQSNVKYWNHWNTHKIIVLARSNTDWKIQQKYQQQLLSENLLRCAIVHQKEFMVNALNRKFYSRKRN